MAGISCEEALHRRALPLLEWFTVLWNLIEAGVAIAAGVIAGSTGPYKYKKRTAAQES